MSSHIADHFGCTLACKAGKPKTVQLIQQSYASAVNSYQCFFSIWEQTYRLFWWEKLEFVSITDRHTRNSAHILVERLEAINNQTIALLACLHAYIDSVCNVASIHIVKIYVVAVPLNHIVGFICRLVGGCAGGFVTCTHAVADDTYSFRLLLCAPASLTWMGDWVERCHMRDASYWYGHNTINSRKRTKSGSRHDIGQLSIQFWTLCSIA